MKVKNLLHKTNIYSTKNLFDFKVFFGASDMILHNEDPFYPTEADAEIIGSGTLMCLIIVTPMILLAYAVEGRKRIQATSLDPLFSFAGAGMLIAAGGKF